MTWSIRGLNNFSSEQDWGQCSLEELRDWEQAKEKRKIERVRENCERYTVRKRAINEKKKRVFSLLSCISKWSPNLLSHFSRTTLCSTNKRDGNKIMHLKKKKKTSIIEKSHIPNHSMTIWLIIFFLVMFSTLESTYGGCAPVHYNNLDYLHIILPN